jgi:dolichyl-phosphate-mannose-protein mannosyltransferase
MSAESGGTLLTRQPGRAPQPGTRQRRPVPGSPFWGWIGPLLVTAFGTYLRFSRLGVPHAVVFDETYYVPDAYGILRHGVEINHIKNVNAALAHGHTNILSGGGEFVVHPPLGKMIIAVGEWLFGLTPFGWRFSVAVIGSLSILMTARIARRMTRSTLLGCVAGLLLALDGLEFVLSRTAILDIFVMFWVLAAFGCLLIDRDRGRADDSAETPGEAGPALGIRWWQVLAGLCLGAATASKWNGVWYIPAFAALAFAWDIGARKAAGFPAYLRGALRDAAWLPVSLVIVPLAAYLASYSGWFASSVGYDRNWAAQHGNHTPVLSDLDSLYQYTRAMWHYGVTLSAGHPYKSAPWTWIVLARPVAFYYAKPSGCGSRSCSQEVLALGTPFIWWAGCAALVACLAWWLIRRDWRPGALLLATAAGWLPWFWFALHDNRTEFYFYAVVFDPYLVIAITLCIGLLIGKPGASPARRTAAAVVSGAYLLGVLWDFAYMYPVFAAKIITYSAWLSRMWYTAGGSHGWI